MGNPLMPFNPGAFNWQALSGLASGNSVGEQFANVNNIMAAQQPGIEAKAAENKTLAYLNQFHPEIAAQVTAGMPMQNALQMVAQAQQPKKPNLMNVGDGLIYDADSKSWIQPPEGMRQNQSEYGLNPQYGVDANGNPVIVQLSKDGTSKQTPLPDGVSLSKQPIKLDAGTHFVLLDPITRQPVGTIPKNVAEVEKQKVLGENEGKNVAAAPKDLQAGLNAKSLIQQMKVDPNREWGTGVSSVFNAIPGTPGYDYQRKVDQSKSGAFLTAIEQMRGLGALSNAEGQTATAAVTRMDTATSEGAFKEALADYERIIDQGIARAESRMRSNPTAADQAQQPAGVNTTSSGVKWKVPGQ
jgi:hypothetical protein